MERFRLIAEGPRDGRPLRSSFPFGPPARPIIPYKLYELVAGAVLEARAEPGTPLEAELRIQTPIGRRFVYRAATRAGADGVARLRVPYATETAQPTRSLGPYRLRLGDAIVRVTVREADVRSGAVLRFAGPETGAGG